MKEKKTLSVLTGILFLQFLLSILIYYNVYGQVNQVLLPVETKQFSVVFQRPPEADSVKLYPWSQDTTVYTSIVGGTGTVLLTSNCDNEVFSSLPIGFTFQYNFVDYTTFGLNCNGWISMGSGTPVNATQPISAGATNNVISAFGENLHGAAADNGIYYQTSGSAPNRVLTVEWKNYGFAPTGLNEENFQIKLYETSNQIQFIYGPCSPAAGRFGHNQIGLRGVSNLDYKNRYGYGTWIYTTNGSSNQEPVIFSSNGASWYPPLGLRWTWTYPQPMSFVSCTTTQSDTGTIYKNANDFYGQIIGIRVVTAGQVTPFNATSFTFNTNGSTNPSSDIANAKLWYTGTSSVFAVTNQFGSTFLNPNGSFTISGNQQLAFGTNYFWLTYQIRATATSYNYVDAECNQIVMSGAGGTRIPTVQAPQGRRRIVCLSTVGTGTTLTTTPFNTAYTDGRVQLLYLGSEIRADCSQPGYIESFGFNFQTVAVPIPKPTFRMQNTTLTSLPVNFITTGFTTVYSTMGDLYISSTPGWVFLPMTTKFPWNGGNLLIEICFDGVTAITSSQVYASSTSNIKTVSYFTNNAAGCSLIQGAGSTNRPNARFYVGKIDYPVAVETPGSNVPASYGLMQNYPNPFNPATNIKYQIPKDGFVKLIVYDVLGREVEMLVNENMEAGTYEVNFDGTNYPSGVYFYRLTNGETSIEKKMVLVK